VSQRSINGYPQQLARMLNMPSFTDMTSSGSTVAQILRGGQMLLGPQIDALGPDTRLVTLTAGGNDVNYVGDLTFMAFGNRRGVIGKIVRMLRKEAKPVHERDYDSLEANLAATLREVKRRSPRSRVVVVTYPAILPGHGTCSTLGITEQQAALMRTVGDKLNQVTRDVATREGATIVDMADLSFGHDACSTVPWVNGFRPQTGADFHPTLAGAHAIAKAIMDAISP
jgi:lysophospholipase L1-like esterase